MGIIMLKSELFSKDQLTLETASPLSTEQSEVEIEHVLFARLSNMDVLKMVGDVEHQLQYEYRIIGKDNTPKGTLRSRMINKGEKYILCIKTYRENKDGVTEVFDNVSADMHEAIGLLADRYLEKTRYVFPVTIVDGDNSLSLKFEVDVFINKDGKIDEWVKIDFEVPHKGVDIPELPFQTEEVIDASFGRQLEPHEREIVDAFFDRVAIPV